MKTVPEIAGGLLGSGHCLNETAALLGVSRRTIQRWKKKSFHMATRSNVGGRKCMLTPTIEASLRHMLAQRPTQTQRQLCQEVERVHGVCVSQSTMSRWLGKMAITLKKISCSNTEADQPRVKVARTLFLQRMKSEHQHGCWDTFYNVDECHWRLNRTRKYGYARQGHRATLRRRAARGHGYTLVLVIGTSARVQSRDQCTETRRTTRSPSSQSGVVGWQLIDGALTGTCFHEFIETLLIPRGDLAAATSLARHCRTASLFRRVAGSPTRSSLRFATARAARFTGSVMRMLHGTCGLC